MATWEEASKCPRCEQRGQEVTQFSGPNRSTIHTLECRNERCSWFESRWIVQRLEDGSVPQRAGGQKEFPPIPGLSREQAERVVEAIDDEG